MKLSDLAAKKMATDPKFKGNDLQQAMDTLYNQQAFQLRQARSEAKQAKTQQSGKSSSPVSVELTTTGSLQLSKSMTIDGVRMNGHETILQSSALLSLSNLIRPLLGATKAMYRAGGLLQNQPLHETDDAGKRTREVLKDADGRTLYSVDPVSQLKLICHVMETNEQAREALDTIRDVLKDYTLDRMKDLAVTKNVIDSKTPIEVSRRSTRDLPDLSNLKVQAPEKETDKETEGPELG